MSSSVPTKHRQSSQSRKVYYSALAESSQVCQYLYVRLSACTPCQISSSAGLLRQQFQHGLGAFTLRIPYPRMEENLHFRILRVPKWCSELITINQFCI